MHTAVTSTYKSFPSSSDTHDQWSLYPSGRMFKMYIVISGWLISFTKCSIVFRVNTSVTIIKEQISSPGWVA